MSKPLPLLIMECASTLPSLVRLLLHPSMPTVDLDAVLSQIVDAITELHESDDRLSTAALYMCNGEGLSENWIFEGNSCGQELEEKIAHAIVQLGQEIKNNLLNIHAYRNGYCPYMYRNFLNATTIMLCPPGRSSV